MKDFAKSIVCNTKAEAAKVGNGSGDWRGNFYEDSAGNSATVMKSGKGWEVFWEDARGYGKLVGVYKDQNTAKKVAEEVVETEMPDRIKANYRSQAINTKTGNSKVGNGITKFGLGNYVIADGHKAIVLGETVERGPNGIPFGWVTIRWVEGPWKGQSDQQYDYDLKKAQKTGNSKVGNGLDQQEAREFQQSLKPIKSLIEDAGVAAYASPKEAIANLQRAKQESEKQSNG